MGLADNFLDRLVDFRNGYGGFCRVIRVIKENIPNFEFVQVVVIAAILVLVYVLTRVVDVILGVLWAS